MRKLAPREIRLAAVAAAVIIVALVSSRVSTSPSRARGAKAQLAQVEAIAVRGEAKAALLAEYDRLARAHGVPSAPGEPGKEANRLTKLLYDAAGRGKVSLQRVSQAGTQKIRGFGSYDKVVVRADLQSRGLPEMLSFLHELESAPGIFAVEEVIIRSPRKPGQPLSARTAISAFVRRPAPKGKK